MKFKNRLKIGTFLIILSVSANGHANRFKPNNCDFSMRFESAPTVTEQTFPAISARPMQRIAYEKSDFAIVVECLPSNLIRSDEASLQKMLTDKATFEGLSGWGYFNEGKKKYVRGYKSLYGRPFTIHYYAYVGKNSILTVTAAGISSGFPQREIGAFLDSLTEN